MFFKEIFTLLLINFVIGKLAIIIYNKYFSNYNNVNLRIRDFDNPNGKQISSCH